MDPSKPIRPQVWFDVERWLLPSWVRFLNRVLGKLRSPYDVKRRFDHREDMVSLEQVGNFELLITSVFDFQVPGAFVELGCYTGSTTAAIASLIAVMDPTRELHVYDRFDIELGSTGNIRARFEQAVLRTGAPLPVVHQGDVFLTVPTNLPDKIAFAHVDLGTGVNVAGHSGLIAHALGAIYPRLSPGGVLVLMDYHVPGATIGGHDSNPGVRVACDKFFVDKPERIRSLYGGPCSHAYVRKA